MSNSFHSAMNDLVMEDATRMSGRDFAHARGVGVARRVRTRRRVRAASVGGVSAVAVGALAVGATQVPWSPLAAPAAAPDEPATSPFQCGFVFTSETQSVDGMTIEDTGWLTAGEVHARLDRYLNTPMDSAGNPVEAEHIPVTTHVDDTQLLPTFAVVDPRGAASIGGAIVTEDPTHYPPDTLGTMQDASGAVVGQTTSGMTFVAVSQATVVGTMTDPWQPEKAPHVAWVGLSEPEESGVSALTLINPDGAFTAC
ncbi:MAG: hypothetical protein H5T82_08065, partial [Demequina sp.]|nr:hypothetical protein [Demequina sp.]